MFNKPVALTIILVVLGVPLGALLSSFFLFDARHRISEDKGFENTYEYPTEDDIASGNQPKQEENLNEKINEGREGKITENDDYVFSCNRFLERGTDTVYIGFNKERSRADIISFSNGKIHESGAGLDLAVRERGRELRSGESLDTLHIQIKSYGRYLGVITKDYYLERSSLDLYSRTESQNSPYVQNSVYKCNTVKKSRLLDRISEYNLFIESKEREEKREEDIRLKSRRL